MLVLLFIKKVTFHTKIAKLMIWVYVCVFLQKQGARSFENTIAKDLQHNFMKGR